MSLALRALSGKETEVPPIQVNVAGMDEFGVTRFAAEVTHRPPADETFDKVASEADPRNWSKDFPEMFAKSYRIRNGCECVDRYEDPDPDDNGEAPGLTWQGPLFETAQFALGGTPLIVFRNVLDIEFTVDRKGDYRGTLDTNYCLHESLSNSTLDFARPGGLDVDSAAHGTCQVSLKGKGAVEEMTTKAAKNLRFSEDAEFSEELNVLALPFIQTWITQLLINSMKL
jgi:hypothetical protein